MKEAKRIYPSQPEIKGTAFCVKVGDRIYACNPYENWDKGSWFEAPLEGPFISLRAELPVNSFLVGKQEGRRLLLHLNGRQEVPYDLPLMKRAGRVDLLKEVLARRERRATTLVIEARGLIEVRVSPKDREARRQMLSGGRKVKLTVSHEKGWCDVEVEARE